MNRFENVDVLAALEQLMRQNTAFYRNDFEIDKEIIGRAAASDKAEDRTLLWMSRPSGTHCFRESDVYLQGTRQHNTWKFYGEQTRDRVLAYAVELTGKVRGVIRGNLYEPDWNLRTEQLVRMAVAVAGLRALAQWGAGYGCAAVLLGNTVSEGVSCGVMLAFAARTPEFVPRPGAPLHPYTRRELYDILWPVEGSRLLASALQAAESSLIPYTLALCTGSRTEAVAQYGSLKGMALPLLFFPFSVLGALSGLLMPEITRAHTKGDTVAMRRLIFTMLRLTGAFSLAAGAGFVVFGAPLAQFVYHDAEVGRYVQILGFVAPFMYLESMVDGVLKGLGEQLATFRYSLLDSILRITAIWFVVPKYGMMGFLGVMVVSNLMTFCLNMKRMMEQIKKPSPDGGRRPKAG